MILNYGYGNNMVLENWTIEEMTGYKPISTYYTDFSIAEKFGKDAIVDTYNTAMENWKTDYKWLTEIVMVLNWKMWRHSEDNIELSKLYQELWEKASNYAETHLKDEELSYYYRTTD